MRVGLRFAVRGTWCFAAGGLLAGAGQWLAFAEGGSSAAALPRAMPLLVGMAFLGGTIGSALFGYRQCLSMHRLRPLAGFGAGFGLAALVVMATLSGVHGGGDGAYRHAALGLGAGFGLAGGIGGVCLDPIYLLPGLLAFGVAGAIGGPLTLWLMMQAGGLGWGHHGLLAAQTLGVTLTYAMGGAGFGAFIR